MRLLGRILDAFRTLVGRSEAQIELARMRGQFLDIMVEVTSALEKMNAMQARFAKREARELAKSSEPEEEKPLELNLGAPPGGLSSRKAELYRRARARKEKGEQLNVG